MFLIPPYNNNNNKANQQLCCYSLRSLFCFLLSFVWWVVFLQRCASPQSFTVVVLMRDESGYMMLLLLPFHQQRNPTNTQQTHRLYRGIPLWQRASCLHKHPRFAASKQRTEASSGLFVAPGESARSGFYCTCSGCVFFSALDWAWH